MVRRLPSAQGRDALISWWTLFERSELVRPPQARVRPILMRPDGASLVLGPFAPQQWLRPSGHAKQQARLPGRNPATQNITLTL
ncbi:MAG: hypothetical protein OEV70_12825, partial [Nitrospirota bacterium]|nr:hypothetical protein [Nitrospirota bacterium]